MENFDIHQWQAKYLREDSSRKQTAIDWLEEKLRLSFGDELKSLRGFFVLAKEMEKEQIEEAYYDGKDNIPSMTPEEYYNSNYR